VNLGDTLMKKDLRMNAKSPDPDDLADEDFVTEERQRREKEFSRSDRSAPHIPPLERGRIRNKEDDAR
jgi:hypothetical protein